MNTITVTPEERNVLTTSGFLPATDELPMPELVDVWRGPGGAQLEQTPTGWRYLSRDRRWIRCGSVGRAITRSLAAVFPR